MARKKITKTEEVACWVAKIHDVTEGVWLTPALVMLHFPGGKISKRTAARAISDAMQGNSGANDAKTDETVH